MNFEFCFVQWDYFNVELVIYFMLVKGENI